MKISFKLLFCISLFTVLVGCRESNKTKPAREGKSAIQDGEKSPPTINPNKHTSMGGVYSFERPEDFGLAIREKQILVKSVIPPCGEGFDYCLYYNGKKYKNTNFETAGIGFYSIESESLENCLDQYNGSKENLHTETINGKKFTVFSSGNAATGHYAKDVVYQTFQNGKCYKFVARIGVSQFQNYEPGTIEKFDREMEDEVRSELRKIIRKVEFQND